MESNGMNNMKTRQFTVTGMTCSACSSHVEKAVAKIPGVAQVSVNLLTGKMQVTCNDSLTVEEIVTAVEKAGYGAQPITEKSTVADNREPESDKKKVFELHQEEEGQKGKQFVLSLCFLIPLFYIAMHEMFHSMFGLPIPAIVSDLFDGVSNSVTFGLTQLLLALPALYINRNYFSKGISTLLHGSPNMDSLIAIGAGVSALYGIFGLLCMAYGLGHGQMELVEHYRKELYFESAVMIPTLITLGKYLESKSKRRTSEALQKLFDLSPKMALIRAEDGTEREIPVKDMTVGQSFLLRAGAQVPVDGVIVSGNATLDESAITGESIPVWKKAGDSVTTATLVKSGFLECRSTRVGEDTTLAQMIRLVEEAGGSKAPIAKLADKVAGVFVPIVMLISCVTFLIWLLCGAEMEFAMSCAIAVLVISCPCALGLATPVAIMVGAGKGASTGVLIKSGEALERAGKVDTVVLDKTGTITKGQIRVQEIRSLKDWSEEEVLKTAASLEEKSEHPLAEAVILKTREMGMERIPCDSFETVPGKGIKGSVHGVSAAVGNLSFLKEEGFVVEGATELESNFAGRAMTPLFVGAHGEVIGAIAVSDTIKETSREAVAALKRLGIQVMMLTGDLKQTAEVIKEEVGIDTVIAQVLPNQKKECVEQLMKQGKTVAMVGDGINDAPALATADVGIAIGAGTDIAMESADVVLMKSDLLDVANAIRLSRAVLRTIKQNLFWAFFYNVICIPLAAGVLYPFLGIRFVPMLGAATMSISSLCVVTNALRLRLFKPLKGSAAVDEGTTKSGENPEETDIIKIMEDKKMKKTITIEGMMCAHCTGRVQKALEAVAGVTAVEMSLENKTATVVGESLDDKALTEAVTQAGYEVLGIE